VERRDGQEQSGLEGAAEVFTAGAWLVVGAGLLCLERGWFPPLSGRPLVLLGFEMAALALTVAVVCLAVDPRAPRRTWGVGGAAILLVALGVAFVVPRLL
jgi:hypothetical protein